MTSTTRTLDRANETGLITFSKYQLNKLKKAGVTHVKLSTWVGAGNPVLMDDLGDELGWVVKGRIVWAY